MTEPTKDQIKEWKSKYSSCYSISAEGEECIIFSPFDNITIMKYAFATLMTDDRMAFVDAILNNCFLHGDESLKKDEKFKMGVYEQLNEIVEVPDFEIEPEGENFIVTVEGKSCKLRALTREDIKWVEKRNKALKPFEGNIMLVDRLAVEGVEEFRKNGRLYFALLMAVHQCKGKKEVEVKKLY